MSTAPIEINAYGPSGAARPAASENRQSGPSMDFNKMMASMGQTMQYSMANQFLAQSLGEGGEGGMGGGGMMNGQIQMNMIMTMMAMQLADRLNQGAPAREPEAAAPEAEVPDEGIDDVGGLSSRFESGRDGPAAVGFDRVGGTSYGTFQLSSAKGSLQEFLGYLEAQSPALAERLREAGPANTGSASGAMPDAWRAIAAEFPEEFGRLQREFVEKTHYRPALSGILEQLGIGENMLPKALREVVFSTAVQHGATGAQNVFGRVLEDMRADGSLEFYRDLIEKVYAERGRHFGGSTERVREAVLSRFTREKALAVAALENAAEANLS